MKINKYYTVGPAPKSNSKFIERDKIDTHNPQIHDRSLSGSVTDTSIKSGWVNLGLWAQIYLFLIAVI